MISNCIMLSSIIVALTLCTCRKYWYPIIKLIDSCRNHTTNFRNRSIWFINNGIFKLIYMHWQAQIWWLFVNFEFNQICVCCWANGNQSRRNRFWCCFIYFKLKIISFLSSVCLFFVFEQRENGSEELYKLLDNYSIKKWYDIENQNH